MKRTAAILQPAIDRDYQKLRETFRVDPYYAIQILIRWLDFISLFYWNSKYQTPEQVNEFREYFGFGWAPLLKAFLKTTTLADLTALLQHRKKTMTGRTQSFYIPVN